MSRRPQVAANPYPWPFDGGWSGEDTALLLIGLQADALAEVPADEAVTRLAALVARWRQAGGPVLHTRRGYDPVVGLPPPVAWRNARRLGDRILLRGTRGFEIDPRVAPAAGEPVIDHPGDNAFLGTDLAFLLARAGYRNLILGGVRTEGAVHATMRAANDLGFECLLLEDGTATDNAEAQATIVRITRFGNGLFGCTAPIAAVEAGLDGAFTEGGR